MLQPCSTDRRTSVSHRDARAHAHAHNLTHARTNTRTNTRTHARVRLRVCVRTHRHTPARTRAHIYAGARAHARAHTRTHLTTHLPTHTRARRPSFSGVPTQRAVLATSQYACCTVRCMLQRVVPPFLPRRSHRAAQARRNDIARSCEGFATQRSVLQQSCMLHRGTAAGCDTAQPVATQCSVATRCRRQEGGGVRFALGAAHGCLWAVVARKAGWDAHRAGASARVSVGCC
jgi:hypothetical protein